MFIETLEFTIPVDLCDVFSTLKKGPRTDLEFPASVNSYGTTQDANIQVALKCNKLTFKVEGVSSNSSMISKSECRTLKLSVFDVDCSLLTPPPKIIIPTPTASHVTSKRTHDHSIDSSQPPKNRRTFSDRVHSQSPTPSVSHRRTSQTHNNHTGTENVNVKQEPEDPDLIEIEPDPETDDTDLKTEVSFGPTGFSSNDSYMNRTQTDDHRLTHSQSPSSFQQNVPHVPDYAEPGPSHHGDQSAAGDYISFQGEGDNEDYDNEADYSNDGPATYWSAMIAAQRRITSTQEQRAESETPKSIDLPCHICGRIFNNQSSRYYHIKAIHDQIIYACACGKTYNRKSNFNRHKRKCVLYSTVKGESL